MGRARGRRNLGRRHRQARPGRSGEASRPRRRLRLLGEIDEPTQTLSRGRMGERSSSTSLRQVPVMPPSVLRTLAFGTGVLLLGRARPWSSTFRRGRTVGRRPAARWTCQSRSCDSDQRASDLGAGTRMSKLVGFGTLLVGVIAGPAIAIVALIGQIGSAIACAQLTGTSLSSSAPVPAQARLWIALTHSVCPDLPEPWIAAVMAQESGFHPDAHADDVNGGTWGLFQINEGIWRATYGAGWDADLNHNGVWDVKDPEIHAVVGGKYLCKRLDGVRRIRAEHPDWASTRDLTELDALVVAHNAGESRLATYPSIPEVTAGFVRTVRAHVAAWSAADARCDGRSVG